MVSHIAPEPIEPHDLQQALYAPVMRRGAGLHRDDTVWLFIQKLGELRVAQLFAACDFACDISVVDLKNAAHQVDTDDKCF